MLKIDANVSRYSFECANLAPDTFQVVSFHGTEAISEPFRFELNLVSKDPDISFADVVNQPATFSMMRGMKQVPVNGIVTHLEQAGRSPDDFVYRATLRPRLWLLSLSLGSRVFKNMKADEIVRQVLDDAGIKPGVDVEFNVGSHPTREFCVQYKETDLNFVSRLLEHEGICYFFKHDGVRDKLIVTDNADQFAAIPDESVLRYDDHTGLSHEEEVVYDVIYRERTVTGSVLMAQYNPDMPSSIQQGEKAGGDGHGRLYDYGSNFVNGGDGRQLAEIRHEEIDTHRRILEGTCNSPAVQSGSKFSLENHYRKSFNQDYLITRVEHRGSQSGPLGLEGVIERTDGNSQQPPYENKFTAIPAEVAYRPPRRTPVPNVPGVITAQIESAGKDGKYAYIDDEGRYHARFHFDLDNQYGKGNATHPLRMVQSYTGADYGFYFGNHEYTEMVLACINGDIDQPIALGTVPNPNNKSPVVAANRMQNIIRTKAGNEILLDDTEKEAQVRLQTPDLHRILLDDKDDQMVLETTKKHKVTLDDKNEKVEVKTTSGHFALMDDKNKKVTLQSKDGHRISINDADKLITMVDESGDNLFQIDFGNKKLTIKSAKGDIEMLAPDGTIDIKATTVNVESSADTTIKADGNIKAEAASNFDAKAGHNFTAEAGMDYKQKGMNVKSEASMQHGIKGMQVKSEGSAMNDMQGAMVSVKASGITQVQGSLVKIN